MHSGRSKRSGSYGFTVVEVVAALALIGVLGLGGLLVYRQHNANPQTGLGNFNGAIACKVTGGIKFCVQSSTSAVSSRGRLEIKATLKNQTAESYSAVFSTGCTEPSLEINGKDQMDIEACTEAIINVNIAPGETKTYDLPVDISELHAGENTLILKWNGDKFSSAPLNVRLTRDYF